MKALILSMLVLTIAFFSNAQNVTIPDTAFLYALIDEGVDTNGDSLISYAEAEAVTSLDVGGLYICNLDFCGTTGKISNLKGIEAFINLESLSIQANKIDNLDLSMNRDLTYLDCHMSQLDSLDVSDNIALSHLDCGYNGLTSLDVSDNIALSYLSCCYNQKLTSLDLSKNNALSYLDCSFIHILTSLDITNCTALTVLNCRDNQLTSLDISDCTALIKLYCSNNRLTSLNVSDYTALSHLSCVRNYLTSLDITNCTALIDMRCFENQLTNLDVSDCNALTKLYCSDNQLNSLDVSASTALSELNCRNNQLTSLDISDCTALKSLDCEGNQLTSLDVSNNTALQLLYLGDMPTLYKVCVWEMPFPPGGVRVYIAGSPNVQFNTDCVVNIPNAYKENNTINIYPNPSDDLINIEIENINNVTIEIYNVSGNLIFSKTLNSKVEKIDISGLSMGMYFVKVRQENNIKVEKLIVF